MFKTICILALMVSMAACAPRKGDKGDTGATGATGQTGTIGPTGPAGNNGNDGVDGTNGHDGATGPRGADGAIATVLQLCPGYSNYGTFVETALCINNQLYGVYSANGGFLTLLAPGRYTSNGIGSACSFSVLPDCVVTP